MEEFILNHHPQPDAPSGLPRPVELGKARYAESNWPAFPVEGRGNTAVSSRFPTRPSLWPHPPGLAEAGQAAFLTWILRDSLPPDRCLPDGVDLEWQSFTTVDRLLDEARSGPLYLRQREIAAMVVETVVAYGGALRQYDLHSYVIMPNHIHLLLTPRVELRRLTEMVKSVTARWANELLGQPGAPFWGERRCEHVVRDQHEFGRICQYIECNPVPVGMASEAADWPFSSAGRKAFAQRA